MNKLISGMIVLLFGMNVQGHGDELSGQSTHKMSTALSEASQKMKMYAQDRANPAMRGFRSLKKRAIDPGVAAANKMEIRRIIHELKNDPDNDPSRILADIQREKKIDEDEETQKEIDEIKWQNTLLTDPTNFVGLYKGDFIQSGLLIADILADVKLYNVLTRRRIEHIINSILSDIDMFIALLKQVNESEARYEERMAGISAFAQMFIDQVRGRDILLNPLRRYLVDNHSLMKGYMPFNRETIAPLMARWVAERASDWVQGKLLVPSVFSDMNTWTAKDVMKKFANPRILENLDARRCAFQPNKAGYLVAFKPEEAPFSVTAGLKALLFLINPIKAIQKLTYTDTSNPWIWRAWFANKVAGLGLPEFIFSDPVKHLCEVAGIVIAAKRFDAINTSKWGTYVLQNRDDLNHLLLDYRHALDNASSGDTVIAQAAQAIREFVEKGHESSSWIPGTELSAWWMVRDEGRNDIHSLLRNGIAALLVLKLGHWWFTKETPQPED